MKNKSVCKYVLLDNFCSYNKTKLYTVYEEKTLLLTLTIFTTNIILKKSHNNLPFLFYPLLSLLYEIYLFNILLKRKMLLLSHKGILSYYLLKASAGNMHISPDCLHSLCIMDTVLLQFPLPCPTLVQPQCQHPCIL